jgi:mRNA interferase MazF
MTFLPGDIILIHFPFTDLTIIKKRPALVISGSQINSRANIICVQITSKIKNDMFSFQIDNSVVSTPLPQTSEIRCDMVFTLQKTLAIRKLSELNSNALAQVIQRINSFLG